MDSEYASLIAPLYNAAVYPEQIVTLYCGVNDEKAGTTPANTFNNSVAPFVAAAKATGFTVIVFTLASFNGEGVVTSGWRDTFNGLVKTNAVADGYTVADVASDANMGCNGCYTNSTYFQSDGIHPTATGHSLIGVTYAVPVLNTAGYK